MSKLSLFFSCRDKLCFHNLKNIILQKRTRVFIVLHNFSAMERCHCRLRCWQKSDLVCQTVRVFVICIVTVKKKIHIFAAACWTSGLSWRSIFRAGKKCKPYLFLVSLKCKSTRRLCKKGLGSRQRAVAYPRCRCRSARETAQHITCSLRSAAAASCVSGLVSELNIFVFFFAHCTQ